MGSKIYRKYSVMILESIAIATAAYYIGKSGIGKVSRDVVRTGKKVGKATAEELDDIRNEIKKEWKKKD